MSDFTTYTRNEDHALFLLVKKRDEAAFSVIYQKYHAYLYQLALRYLKNVPMAEDAVQHVFVKLWEVTKDIEIEVNLKNYLYTMTKNYILNQIRNYKDVISIHYINAQSEMSDNSEFLKQLEEVQLSDFLRKGIDTLPPQKREVCKLKIEQGFGNQDIAIQMGLSVHTVKSHYQESIKMLRDYFRRNKIELFR
ncbi:MAG: RNA polymerase sigma-70 factor [Dysgonamonadaceae bacterium]|jgi:RNA polymerase sigma-70 factor (ECF subfamily)|nr:RNA polymerase sigma-70 factor [Dysgonamonadaceae bacterium]